MVLDALGTQRLDAGRGSAEVGEGFAVMLVARVLDVFGGQLFFIQIRYYKPNLNTPSSTNPERLVVTLLAELVGVVVEVVHQLEPRLFGVTCLQGLPQHLRLRLAQTVVYYVSPYQHDLLVEQQLGE